jgi:hypothetical protein
MTDIYTPFQASVGKPLSARLSDLLLDGDNPRFGDGSGKMSQADILDYIVQKFGVTDVISSLAVNGYFEAEPLVLKDGPPGKFIVAEGNRRLAACLILVGDDRASRQQNLSAQYQAIWKAHNSPTVDPAPAIVFEGPDAERSLLSYLGVRHIASARAWDSYAKAAWVSRIVQQFGIPVRDVSLMIGDQYQTISRMLQGYNVVKQLESKGQFRPEDSQRRGRGSVTQYPFSWVYTLLGYSAPRNYLGISDDDASPAPIPEENLPRGGIVMRAMFGDKSTGKEGAITDSRELGQLASAFADEEKISLIESGHSITEIDRLTQPARDLLRQGLADVRNIQADMIQRLAESPLGAEEAAPLVGLATKNRSTASEIERRLREAGAENG